MRYYFDHTQNGRLEIDDEGLEFADQAVAEQHAIRALFQIAGELAGSDRDTTTIDIRGPEGPVARLKVDFLLERQK